MNTRQLSIVIAAVAWSSAIAYAATQGASEPGKSPPASNASSMFEQLDQNKDRLIDMSEAGRSAQVKGEFKKIDGNNDGKISQDEWARFSTTQGNSPR
jgi:Ca2+-binding EF-hand superfamily protein